MASLISLQCHDCLDSFFILKFTHIWNIKEKNKAFNILHHILNSLEALLADNWTYRMGNTQVYMTQIILSTRINNHILKWKTFVNICHLILFVI